MRNESQIAKHQNIPSICINAVFSFGISQYPVEDPLIMMRDAGKGTLSLAETTVPVIVIVLSCAELESGRLKNNPNTPKMVASTFFHAKCC
ncbi:MAG: hypothetical protein R3C61_07140 [Bacteroidia bacterium]